MIGIEKKVCYSDLVALKRAVEISLGTIDSLLGAGVLGNGLCAFADSVLGQFAGK